MDECLTVLRGLLSGHVTNFSGEFFELRDAVMHPVPQPPVPILLGGRSVAALRRAGDGWLALFVSAKRYAEAVSEVAELERCAPYGTAVDVAEALAPYVEAGCRTIYIIPMGSHPERSVEDVADTRRLLREGLGV